MFSKAWSVLVVLSLCWSGSLLNEAVAAEEEQSVALLVSSSLWSELQSDIEGYMEDVRAESPVRFEVVVDEFRDPQHVRGILKGLWSDKKIVGAILVGAVPMHRFFMHEHANPNPLYYEDFDLDFVDTDGDGVSDHYRTAPSKDAPDIKLWVANIRSDEKSATEDVAGLRRFFAKARAFRRGELDYSQRAIVVTDAELGLRSEEVRLGRELFGRRGVTLLATPNNTLTKVRDAFAKQAYAICVMGVHSDWEGQELVGGDISSQEIGEMKTGALLTLNHGCFTGNWCVSEKVGSGRATAQSWVFGNGIGLAVVANVRSGCIYGYEELCEQMLRDGTKLQRSFGAAYLAAKRAGERQMHAEYPDGSIVSGVLLIGDPFLTIDRVER